MTDAMSAATDHVRRARPWLQRLFLWTAVVILAPASLALAATLLLGRPLPWQFHVPWVSPHIVAALLALALGILQLGLRKGDRRHRLAGYAWCALIAFICLSGLGIRLEPGHVTIVHKISSVFAIGDLFLVPVVIFAGRTGRRRLHRFAVLAIFAFMLNAGLLAFVPFRALGGLVLGLFH